MIYLTGFPQVANLMMNMKGGWVIFYPVVKLLYEIGVMPHFQELSKGVLGFNSIIFFLSFIAFCLFATSVVLRIHRA